MAVLEAFLGPYGAAVAGLVASGASPGAAVGSALWGHSLFVVSPKYKLKCWEASDDTPTTFCKGPGQLFFSKVLFKWKDRVPGQK